ncbi:MAG: SUMF1/EgtB/PvdO family nonheme iron enzyme [Polyangiaceae bacterium]
MARIVEGDTCDPTQVNPCVPPGHCDSASSRCVPLPGPGEACFKLTCRDDSYCDGSYCKLRLVDGSDCRPNGVKSCVDGDACQPPPAAGSGGSSGAGGAPGTGGGSGSGGASSVPGCGNGALAGAELCDDGNAADGDGCNARCEIESGFACTGSPSACNRSCNGLGKTCGPLGDQDCCASALVTGGTFNRSNDPAAPATVGNFRLDVYEVTVGRFRKFVDAFSQDMTPIGAGANASDPGDLGWNTNWNYLALPRTQTALRTQLARGTWTDSPDANESLPINYVNWAEGQAFCIWDGGRLPTEAEWNYAAAGGAEQRTYPWGSAIPDCSFANFFNGAYCVNPGVGWVNRVGSESPKGDGKFGQADLAGNVAEMVLDHVAPYTVPCNGCGKASGPGSFVLRGGGYSDPPELISTSYFADGNTYNQNGTARLGLRCRRAP